MPEQRVCYNQLVFPPVQKTLNFLKQKNAKYIFFISIELAVVLSHNNECPYYPVKNKHTYKSKYVLPCFKTEVYIEARVCYLRYPVSEHRYILIQATML